MVPIPLQISLKRIKTILGLAFQAIGLIGAVAAILATSAAGIAFAWVGKQADSLLALTTFLAGFACALAISLYVYFRASPVKWLLRGYRWVSAEYLYKFHDDDPAHHSQTISIELEALRSGVDHFENRYLWSGVGREDDPKILSQHHSLMGSPIRRRIWKYYFVHLGSELAIGGRTRIEIFQELYDTENKFEPFLAKTILEPVDYLVLRVVFAPNRLPKDVYRIEERAAVPANDLIRTESVIFDQNTREVRYEVHSPVFKHRYEIHWSW